MNASSLPGGSTEPVILLPSFLPRFGANPLTVYHVQGVRSIPSSPILPLAISPTSPVLPVTQFQPTIVSVLPPVVAPPLATTMRSLAYPSTPLKIRVVVPEVKRTI